MLRDPMANASRSNQLMTKREWNPLLSAQECAFRQETLVDIPPQRD